MTSTAPSPARTRSAREDRPGRWAFPERTLKAVAVALLVAAASCSDGSSRRTAPTTPRAGLPPATLAGLAPIFGPELEPLGVRLTRGALVNTSSRRPSPTGRHLALYVEPTANWSYARYAETIVPLTRLLATRIFERWPAIESFDVCQEPPPGVDDRPEPDTVSTVELTREGAASIEWGAVDLPTLLASADRPGGGVQVVASKALLADPAYREATATAARRQPAG